jgi:tetratricopeptide (TPR) repeat protein
MPPRALIIAIENYQQMQGGFATQLPGTEQSALAFHDWLVTQKKVNLNDIIFCSDDKNCQKRTMGATRGEVKTAFAKLVTQGKDCTSELYFFFSGHGFLYKENEGLRKRALDVLIAEDFETLQGSGDRCVLLEEIQTILWQALGPGEHYYFIDACRNQISSRDINVSNLGWSPTASQLGTPAVYTLFSTTRGATASVTSEFSRHLLDGLMGKGRAQAWNDSHQKLFVKFDSLRGYIKHRLHAQEIDSRVDGTGEGNIIEIRPIPCYKCTVVVENAEHGDTFSLTVKNSLGQEVLRDTFSGDHTAFSQVPFDYQVTLLHPALGFSPSDTLPAALYEDQEVKFKKLGVSVGPRFAPPSPPQSPRLKIYGAPRTVLTIRNIQQGEIYKGSGPFDGSVPAGNYLCEIHDLNGVIQDRKEISLKSDETYEDDLGAQRRNSLQRALLSHLPSYAYDDRTVEFSETLGPLSDPNLAVWLSIIGGSRIVEDPKYRSKLGQLPLATFYDAQPDTASMYILAGFDDQHADLEVALSNGISNDWSRAIPVPGIDGLYEWKSLSQSEGSRLLSLRVREKATVTLATYLMANRATLVVLTQDFDAPISVQQYLLPVHTLVKHLDFEIQRRLHARPLQMIKFIAKRYRQFRHRQELSTNNVSDGPVSDPSGWWDLLVGKWLDPIMAVMAGYELIRRGQRQDSLLSEAVNNLLTYFPGLPDSQAIAKLAGNKGLQLQGLPLFLDGLLAFENYQRVLPLPQSRLDFRGPWIFWIGIVPQSAEELVQMGREEEAFRVLDVAGESLKVKQLRALALAKTDNIDEAIQILERLYKSGERDAETSGLLAGRYKQKWCKTEESQYLKFAYDVYKDGFDSTKDSFAGINAAATALYLGDHEKSKSYAKEVLSSLDLSKSARMTNWDLATLGEAHLLLGDFDAARQWYMKAVLQNPRAYGAIAEMRRQARRNLKYLGGNLGALDSILFCPCVVAFTGHMTDEPDRMLARFPEEKVSEVEKAIRQKLDDLHAWYGFSSAARGSDILFIEEMLRRDGLVRTFLPFSRSDFSKTSVGSRWNQRYCEVLGHDRVDVTVLSDNFPPENQRPDAYASCNRLLLQAAVQKAERLDVMPVLLGVINSKSGNGKGGSADTIQTWRNTRHEVELVDIGEL